MKKVLLFAVAAATLFASCAKDGNNNVDEEVTYGSLALRVVTPKLANTRNTEAGYNAGSPVAPDFNDGIVFVIEKGTTKVLARQVLSAADATTLITGVAPADQVRITGTFPSTARVLIYGNVPDDIMAKFTDSLTVNTSVLADVLRLRGYMGSSTPEAGLTSTPQANYLTDVFLGNIDNPSAGTAGAIDWEDLGTMALDGVGPEFVSNVHIAPMISRIELTRIQASGVSVELPAMYSPAAGSRWVVKSFNVTGVFLDKFPQWTKANGLSYVGTTPPSNAEGVFDIIERNAVAPVLAPTAGDLTKLTAFWTGYVDGADIAAAGNANLGTSTGMTLTTPNVVDATTNDLQLANVASAVPMGGVAGTAWAYNVASGEVPSLLIRLSGVTFEDIAPIDAVHTAKASDITYNQGAWQMVGTVPGVGYLRVAGYKKNNAAKDVITALQKGNIYRIGTSTNLDFTPLNLMPTIQGAQKVALDVEVSVDNWAMNDVNGDLE